MAKCRICGATNVRWEKRGRRWVLLEMDGKIHKPRCCETFIRRVNEFCARHPVEHAGNE